jgi:hypothetical protein
VGQDLLSQLKAQRLLPTGDYLCCPLLQKQTDPTLWTDEMTVQQANTALSIQINLKDTIQFPHQQQYPLKPEGQQGKLPINSLKRQGLFNTPILAVQKVPDK